MTTTTTIVALYHRQSGLNWVSERSVSCKRETLELVEQDLCDSPSMKSLHSTSAHVAPPVIFIIVIIARRIAMKETDMRVSLGDDVAASIVEAGFENDMHACPPLFDLFLLLLLIVLESLLLSTCATLFFGNRSTLVRHRLA